jgi:hypothetical protein
MEPLVFVWMLYGPYGLALIALFRVVAARSLAAFWPATGWPIERLPDWHYRFVTVPGGFGLASVVIGTLISIVSLVGAPAGALGVAGDDLGVAALAFLPMSAFGYSMLPISLVYTVHGLRLVTRIHREAAAINPFDRSAVNAFSVLTALVGLGYVSAGYYSLTVNGAFQAGNVASILSLTASVLAGIVFFVVPLWGIHGRLQQEKLRLLLAAEARADATSAELYRRIDAGEFEAGKNLADTLAGVAATRHRIVQLPTWPWPPELLRGFVSALLLPVAIYLLTRLLSGVIGA